MVNKYPPGPRTRIPGSFFLRFRRDPIGWLLKMARDYGDIAHFQLGPHHVYLLNHPDLIKDVLVTHDRKFMKGRALQRTKILLGEGLLTSEGEFHLRQRRMIQPVFLRQRILEYAFTMTNYAEHHCKQWQDGQTLDVAQEMMRLTMRIVAKTLFDTELQSGAEKISKAMSVLMEMFNFLMLPYSELLEKLPLPGMLRAKKAIRDLDEIIYRMIRERQSETGTRGDLLSMLVQARDEEDDGGRMTHRQIRDEAMTIFLAGHETTANALTWTWYLLSKNPDVEAQLHSELDSVLTGRLPTLEDLDRLKYTEMVFAESMRLFPPAWIIGRRALHDYETAGYRIPVKSIIVVSQYLMHHDSRFWPDPWRFDPERWTAEARAQRPKFAYFPFGGGSRICIGEHFAWMEGILLIATIAQRWKMQLVRDHPVQLLPAVTLRPKYGMRMVLQKRVIS